MPGDLLTTVLAMWGAGLSTILAANELRKGKPRIRVTCSYCIVVQGVRVGTPLIEIDAVNVGERPVELRAAGFLLSDTIKLVGMLDVTGRTVLPKKLDTGETATLHLDRVSLTQELKQHRESRNATLVAAYVADAEGRRYKARAPRELDWAVSRRWLWWCRVFRLWPGR